MENRNGFTLTEMLISIALIMIMASVATISMSSARQTPKREAEKIAAYIARLTEKSDRMKLSFDVAITTTDSAKAFNVSWGKHGSYTETFELDYDLTYAFVPSTTSPWVYDYINYPNGIKVAPLSSKLSSGSDHKYIEITSTGSSSPYYVLLTGSDSNN